MTGPLACVSIMALARQLALTFQLCKFRFSCGIPFSLKGDYGIDLIRP